MDVAECVRIDRQTNKQTSGIIVDRAHFRKARDIEAFVNIPILPINKPSNDTLRYNISKKLRNRPNKTKRVNFDIHEKIRELIRYIDFIDALLKIGIKINKAINFAYCVYEWSCIESDWQIIERKGIDWSTSSVIKIWTVRKS